MISLLKDESASICSHIYLDDALTSSTADRVMDSSPSTTTPAGLCTQRHGSAAVKVHTALGGLDGQAETTETSCSRAGHWQDAALV